MEVSCQLHAPAAVKPYKHWIQCCARLRFVLEADKKQSAVPTSGHSLCTNPSCKLVTTLTAIYRLSVCHYMYWFNKWTKEVLHSENSLVWCWNLETSETKSENLNSWFRASWFNVNKKFQLDATICRHLFTAESLYMFRASQHPSSGVLKTVTATSGIGHNTGTATSFQRGLLRSSPDQATLEGSSCTSMWVIY
jgi:hypothetical protein